MTAPSHELRYEYRWGSAVAAGLMAGTLFLALEMVLVTLFLQGSPWGPPRMIAAIVLGRGVLPPPATFDLGIFLVALAVHFGLSVIYALFLARLIGRLDRPGALLTGTAFGLFLYMVNFLGFTYAFPWFAAARNWVTVLSHLVFGFTAAWAYSAIVRPSLPAAMAHRGAERRQALRTSLWTGPERRLTDPRQRQSW